MNEEEELAHLRAPSSDPKQRMIDYWGRRAEIAEDALKKIVDLESNQAISGSGLFMRAVVIARSAIKALAQ